ncbi:uncharacterized protein LY89DRAFT_38900 [Mollisia scopiformis]|uniref:Uncharacterized protein n=1 Tax=Mollisia scopiformis TaxID=149040 RepID=A0A194XDB9_MOLSC|nr:uncharacterized protein LY89DRAFT_38900 [Mollisia scopiformis]KUJ18146.1 hypothetical protein LY89DRAFT_38900 [Mollisia scopiformis]
MATITSSTEILGGRLLREIGAEEGSLEDLLRSLRQTSLPNPSKTGIQTLDTFWSHNGGKLSVTGRGLPFLYQLLTSLLLNLHGTVALLDLTARFSPSHVSVPSSELQHIHVFQPTPSNLKVTLESVEKYMLYSEHGSKGREWVGTIVLGGNGGDINIGWRGWLRVEKEEVTKFGDGVGVEEAWGEKGMRQRQEVVDKVGWRAECEIW